MSDDKRAIDEISALSGNDVAHSILHYLYVPTREVAVQVVKAIQQRGFNTEDRLGADGESWLVLAKHEAVPTEAVMMSIRQSMEELMDAVGGEYDGWEVDFRSGD